jgi:hypothetical protein
MMPERMTRSGNAFRPRIQRGAYFLQARAGYRVCKSREWKHIPNVDNNFGEYMLLNTSSNYPVLGWRYDATLNDIEAFLDAN